MLDPALFRDDLETVTRRLSDRGVTASLERFTRLDGERRRLLAESEPIRHRKKLASQEIGGLLKEGRKDDAEERKLEVRELTEQIRSAEESLEGIEGEIETFLLDLPNVAHESVPVGANESANTVARTVGERTSFDFEPKDHVDIGERLGILDFERSAKIAGARFAVLTGAGALLERALINFMLDLHTREHGYTEVLPPFLANSAALTGSGQLPKFDEDLFKLEGYDLRLVPTAEVPLANLHSGEILDRDQLPIRLTAHTPCFRSEAGSYGKDVRGLIRLHQFNKVELVSICEPGGSYDELERLTANAEEVLKRLELPYRVVTLSTGDMGFAAAKTYDLEVWLPGQETYREISSCSNCESFQARRTKTRFRPLKDGKKAKPEWVHTLNGSGLAVGRTLVAILENYQQSDGSVVVPSALEPYTGGLDVVRPRA